MIQNSCPKLSRIRKQMNKAADDSELSYREIGVAMGQKNSTARKSVQQLLTDESVNFNPRLETLIRFAKAVNKPLEYFF